MALRATVLSAEDAFNRIRTQAAASKNYLVNQRAVMVQSSVPATTPLSVIQHFAQVIPMFNAWAATPGLAQYAKDQMADQTYDVVAEFTAMRDAMVSALNNLIGMFPKDGNGFMLYQTLNADGSISIRNFTAAQVAPAVSLMDSVIAAIA